MGSAGAIPHTALLTWLDRWCATPEAWYLFLEIIPQLDHIYLKHINDAQEKERGRLKGHR